MTSEGRPPAGGTPSATSASLVSHRYPSRARAAVRSYVGVMAQITTAKTGITSQFRRAPLRIDEQRLQPDVSFEDPAQERLHRKQQLAGAFRVFARFGYNLGASGHITARDPELPDHFWVNPLAVPFGQIRVSDLQLVNHLGEIVIGDRPDPRRGRSTARADQGLRRIQLPALLRRHRRRAARPARLTDHQGSGPPAPKKPPVGPYRTDRRVPHRDRRATARSASSLQQGGGCGGCT
jgi:hypothetical protein